MIPLSDRLLKLEMWRVGAIAASHPVFDAPRSAYPDFNKWYRKAQVERRRMYAVTSNSVPVGVAIIKPEGRHLKLCCLSVLVGHEGHGVGSMLMKQFLADAEDFGLEPYFTAKRDPVIEAFATAMGFFEVGLIGGDPHYVPIDLPTPSEET